MRIELDRNVTVEDATQEDIDYVAENFREEDRKENDIFTSGHDTIDLFERCFVIRHKDKTIGYCGIMIVPGETVLSDRRYVCFMTCENANRIKVTFVRMSRKVMQAIVGQVPPWVNTFLTAPVEEYHGTIIWHERVLKMRRYGETSFNGHKVILFVTTRKEVMS